ncbi:hypothetical protein IAG44_03215 [Streptomyces roseirectus]|uniref:Secreted protein n=1 Tax=Streptomyces roseirectus TaxID=2768066 RepID=A0A7H0I713_9ACTN|nr:hypothetical protein [Streptomyces roseirectus]QNP68579.1 hypothetical protein IAG44_03215 [Streptomyces roseirectus]
MRTLQLLVGSGAAAATVALAAGPAFAAGISVSTTGSTVSVVTSTCTTQVDGSYGTGSLLTSSQTSFSQGRQATLSGTTVSQSAAWTNVTPGTYTVMVRCADGRDAGSQVVIVSTASAPTISATSAPSRGVLGGIGGGIRDYGTVTLAAGGALTAVGMLAAGWFLRRRRRPYRL